MKRDFDVKLRDARNILEVQGKNYDCDEYMRGLFNGMEMIMAIFEEREPNFKEIPVRRKNEDKEIV